MKPERWQQIESLLQAALERTPSERAAFLEKECAGDAALRSEVESLLESAPAAENFLESNAGEDAARMLEDLTSTLSRNFGHYSIAAKLGSGGMGDVYLALDQRLGRKVALKILGPGFVGDSEARARLLREARLASMLDHPNVCSVHEVGEAGGQNFIAMQYVEGKTLNKIINGHPLPLDTLLSITLQIADALAEAHKAGIIHRDIKPGNIMVTPRGQVKVLDFGLAKVFEESENEDDLKLTMTGAVMGTPASMSPEQARGMRVDQRSDIFSFGCVLYEMATGQIPFQGKSRADVISALLHQPQTSASQLNPDLPARMSLVIDRALSKEPADRYESVSDLIAEIRQVVTEAGGLDHLFSSSGVPRGIMPLVSAKRSGKVRSPGNHRIRKIALLTAIAVTLLATTALAIYFTRPAKPARIGSIAVLPFKPLGAEGRDEVLELGMADTLIARLSNLPGVDVRPISAVHKYAGLDQDAIAAGKEQRVDAVLDGHIQKVGEKIRITVRLSRVADGVSLWSDKFDSEMTDIFAVQDSISERVTTALAVTLQSDERERLTKHFTKSPEAYQLYSKGRYHLSRLTDDGFVKGRDYFQEAINLDPNYALAYAGLADAYQMLSGFNAVAPSDGFPKARAAAMQALKLDEQLAEAHTALGAVKLLYDWDFQGAEKEYKRAIELNPSYAEAYLLYGLYLSAMKRFDEAHDKMRRAQELEPLGISKVTGAGDVFYQQGKYDQAMEQYNRALELDPNSGLARWCLGNAYVNKGMYNEAIEEYRKAIAFSGDSPDELASLGYAYALTGRTREAEEVIRKLKEQQKRRYISPTIIAFIHAGLGEKDKAFAELEKAYELRDFILVFLNVDPTFNKLRSDERFAKLVNRVGLPQ